MGSNKQKSKERHKKRARLKRKIDVFQSKTLAPICDDAASKERLPNSVLRATESQEGRNPMAQEELVTYGCAVSPPSGQLSPIEFVYTDVIISDFGEKVSLAYELSNLRESYRQHKYGWEAATTWKRGSTPDDVREKWKALVAQQQVEEDNISDSD